MLPSHPLAAQAVLRITSFSDAWTHVSTVGRSAARVPTSVCSEMNVPTWQSYVMAVVNAVERSAAGFTNTTRTFGSLLSPVLAGPVYAGVSVWPVWWPAA